MKRPAGPSTDPAAPGPAGSLFTVRSPTDESGRSDSGPGGAGVSCQHRRSFISKSGAGYPHPPTPRPTVRMIHQDPPPAHPDIKPDKPSTPPTPSLESHGCSCCRGWVIHRTHSSTPPTPQAYGPSPLFPHPYQGFSS
eukprot:753557-Hanusia_phi.AAC.6